MNNNINAEISDIGHRTSDIGYIIRYKNVSRIQGQHP